MFVDDIPVEVPVGSTVIQACAEVGVEIPRLVLVKSGKDHEHCGKGVGLGG